MGFIKAKCKSGYHLIDTKDILRVSPNGDEATNKTRIILRDNYELYSTEGQEELFRKIKAAEK